MSSLMRRSGRSGPRARRTSIRRVLESRSCSTGPSKTQLSWHVTLPAGRVKPAPLWLRHAPSRHEPTSACMSIARRTREHGGVTRPDTRELWNASAAAWTELSRPGFDRYRDLVNTPAFFRLLPAADGLACLDPGCGEGHNARLLAGKGASVAALDAAEPFITAAAGPDRTGICYVVGDGAALPFGAAAFDAVTAFMSSHSLVAASRTTVMRLPGCINTERLLVGANSRSQGAAGR